MMYIVLKGERDITWKVGTEVPNRSPDMVIEIQAKGPELEYIKQNFVNVPFHVSRPTQTWYGEMAQFIFANLESTEK